MHRASVSQDINVVYSLAGGSDYEEIRADIDNRQESFNVDILDDLLFELDVEDFTLELRFAFQQPSNVILSPNVSTIEIVDDDCKILYEQPKLYYVLAIIIRIT